MRSVLDAAVEAGRFEGESSPVASEQVDETEVADREAGTSVLRAEALAVTYSDVQRRLRLAKART